MIEAIIDIRIKKAMPLNEVLHGFCTGRRTGTAVMELNLTHELASVDQELIFMVYLGP